jgi:hypothetical protein
MNGCDNFDDGRFCRQTADFPASFRYLNTVISGFNTDVSFADVVYHVQTEDKGLKSRLLVSLVYDGGTILASKRSSYDDLAAVEKLNENELSERLQKQHKLICAAVKAGRLNDLKRMSASENNKTVKAKRLVPAVAAEIPAYVPDIEAPKPIAVVELQKAVRYIAHDTDQDIFATPTVIDVEDLGIADLDLEIIEDVQIFDAVSVVEEEAVLAPESVAVVSELSGLERPANNKLSLELLGDTKFKGGDRRDVNIMVCRGTERKVISDAQIMIKVLGSSFRPLIFHAKTDRNGLAKVHLQLPHFHAGRAAVLLRAISCGEEIELRRIVTPA